MPKLKTHKGMKKRFKVSASGKVLHKRCGSSHLMSHKNGKQVRRLRKKSALNLAAESRRVRSALRDRNALNPLAVEAAKRAALAAKAGAAATAADNPSSPAPAAAVVTVAEQPSSPDAAEPKMDDN